MYLDAGSGGWLICFCAPHVITSYIQTYSDQRANAYRRRTPEDKGDVSPCDLRFIANTSTYIRALLSFKCRFNIIWVIDPFCDSWGNCWAFDVRLGQRCTPIALSSFHPFSLKWIWCFISKHVGALIQFSAKLLTFIVSYIAYHIFGRHLSIALNIFGIQASTHTPTEVSHRTAYFIQRSHLILQTWILRYVTYIYIYIYIYTYLHS